jgi:hypothetical protein
MLCVMMLRIMLSCKSMLHHVVLEVCCCDPAGLSSSACANCGVYVEYVSNAGWWFDIAQGKQLSQMLDEDPALMERRVQLTKRLELFKQARDEIDAVAWAK